jgi:iron complex transport system ATP-binding protein
MILVARACTVLGEAGQLRLDAVSVELGQGEIHAVIGPNGAGKSTLMGILSGMNKVDSGIVEFNSRPLENLSAGELARVRSVLGQDLAVTFGFTVAEVVAWGRSPWRGTDRTKEDEGIIERAMLATKVTSLRDRPINQLSGGERKRVHIARVIAQDCSLMFFDEPDSDLDLIGTNELDATLRSLNQNGHTLLVSSHNLSWISGLATRVILMGAHKIVGAGPTKEIFTPEMLSNAYGQTISVQWTTDASGRKIAVCTSS